MTIETVQSRCLTLSKSFGGEEAWFRVRLELPADVHHRGQLSLLLSSELLARPASVITFTATEVHDKSLYIHSLSIILLCRSFKPDNMAGSSRNASPIKRLMTELQTYQNDPNDALLELGPTDDDVMHWRAVMKGVQGTAYEGTSSHYILHPFRISSTHSASHLLPLTTV